MGVFHIIKITQIVPNCTEHLKEKQSITKTFMKDNEISHAKKKTKTLKL